MSNRIHFRDPPRPDLADEDETRRSMESGPTTASSLVLGEPRCSRGRLRRGRD